MKYNKANCGSSGSGKGCKRSSVDWEALGLGSGLRGCILYRHSAVLECLVSCHKVQCVRCVGGKNSRA